MINHKIRSFSNDEIPKDLYVYAMVFSRCFVHRMDSPSIIFLWKKIEMKTHEKILSEISTNCLYR